MKISIRAQFIGFIGAALIVAGTASQLFAHAGHDKAPGEEGEVTTSGPITITAEAKTNLALKVEEAKLRTLEKTFVAIGQIESVPSRSAAVTSRISGRLVGINATEGQAVKKGDPLVEVESRQVGNPPPRVQYPAPIDGVVVRRNVLLNGPVEPDKNLLEIVDLSEVYAEGQVFEGQVSRVRVGQKVRVTVESFPDLTFEGAVEVMGGELEPATRTLRIWVRVANPEGKLRPNMRATLSIVTEAADSAIAIPLSAVLGESGNLFAFVQTDDAGLVYERRAVVTGIRDEQYVEIIEGIFEADKVVTLGNYQLQYVTPKAKPKEGAAESAEHKDEPGAAPHEHGAEAAPHSHGFFSSTLGRILVASVILILLGITIAAIRARRRRAREDEYATAATLGSRARPPHESTP